MKPAMGGGIVSDALLAAAWRRRPNGAVLIDSHRGC